MKKIVTLFAALFSFAATWGASVVDIAITPQVATRGMVDIVITLQGTPEDVENCQCEFLATNGMTHSAIPVSHINQVGAEEESNKIWKRQFVWEAEKDIGQVKIDNLEFITVVREKTVGVQLWKDGPYWAECNIGATSAIEAGYYFAWGCTNGYKQVGYYYTASWDAVDGSEEGHSFTIDDCPMGNKSSSQLLSGGFIDNAGNLVSKYDAATKYKGGMWRMPTEAEFLALMANCTGTWPITSSDLGMYFTGKDQYSDKRIFLPTTGHVFWDKISGNPGTLEATGEYWSSTPSSTGSSAMVLTFKGSYGYTNPYTTQLEVPSSPRSYGRTIRPVRDADSFVNFSSQVSLSIDCRAIENPVISPEHGTTFDSSLTISMSCASEGAVVHYTTDGSDPTMESPVYKRFRIYGKTTVKARAFYEDGTGGEIVTAEYALGQCPDPVISTTGGETFYHKGNQVSIAYDCEEGVVHYTTDGSEPTKESPVYERPFTTDESMIVKAKAFSDNYFDSAVVSATLTREWEQVATPAITAEDSFTGAKTKVEISCGTEGATIRYTLNGSDPNSHAKKYVGPFYVTEGCTIKAYAVLDDYTNSEIASKTITKVWGIGDSVALPDQKFTTSGDAEWVDASGEAMESGAITDNQKSILSTTFVGKGVLSFKWKVSCEEDTEEHNWDHAAFFVDGVEIARQDGQIDWLDVIHTIEAEESHTVEWVYVKDEAEVDGEDCMWVKDIVWMPEMTQTSEVKVETTWLKTFFPTLGSYYFDYEEKANETAANGQKVWECYVIGIDPTDSNAALLLNIEMCDKKVFVSWFPDLNEKSPVRVYKLFGRKELDCGEWEVPAKPWHRFFKLSVAMPEDEAEIETAVSGEGFIPQDSEFGGVQLWKDGPYWAENNIGANSPTQSGYYFWWGDVVGYRWYGGTREEYPGSVTIVAATWESSKGIKVDEAPFMSTTCTTYKGYSSTILNIDKDAARAHCGNPWRMPTKGDFEDLINNCDWSKETCDGVLGYRVTGRGSFAEKSIFLPASGRGMGVNVGGYGITGYYWSSSIDTSSPYGSFCLSGESVGTATREKGMNIRPVRRSL